MKILNYARYTVQFSLFIFFFGCFSTYAQTDDNIENLPDLELKLHNNQTINLLDLKGKIVLLDFWHRGCAPCLLAIPDLIQLKEEFKDDLVIIGINDNDEKEDVIKYFDYKKTNYPSTYKTENKLLKLFDIKAFPTVILYGKDGKIVTVKEGYSKKNANVLRKAIKRCLK